MTELLIFFDLFRPENYIPTLLFYFPLSATTSTFISSGVYLYHRNNINVDSITIRTFKLSMFGCGIGIIGINSFINIYNFYTFYKTDKKK